MDWPTPVAFPVETWGRLDRGGTSASRHRRAALRTKDRRQRTAGDLRRRPSCGGGCDLQHPATTRCRTWICRQQALLAHPLSPPPPSQPIHCLMPAQRHSQISSCSENFPLPPASRTKGYQSFSEFWLITLSVTFKFTLYKCTVVFLCVLRMHACMNAHLSFSYTHCICKSNSMPAKMSNES